MVLTKGFLYQRRRERVLAMGKAKAGSRVSENSDLLIVYLHRLHYSIPYGQYLLTLEVPPENRFPLAHSPSVSSTPSGNSMKVFTPYDRSNFENHKKEKGALQSAILCIPFRTIKNLLNRPKGKLGGWT